MIVKLTTYDYKAFVVYNVATAIVNVVVFVDLQSDQHSRLLVKQQQLVFFSHERSSYVVLILFEQDVDFVLKAIQFQQLKQHRSFYINVILIQSRDQTVSTTCTQCCNDFDLRFFFKYCFVRKQIKNTCVNCK